VADSPEYRIPFVHQVRADEEFRHAAGEGFLRTPSFGRQKGRHDGYRPLHVAVRERRRIGILFITPDYSGRSLPIRGFKRMDHPFAVDSPVNPDRARTLSEGAALIFMATRINMPPEQIESPARAPSPSPMLEVLDEFG
jgi:hypothetical protein